MNDNNPSTYIENKFTMTAFREKFASAKKISQVQEENDKTWFNII